MNPLILESLNEYIDGTIALFHQKKIASLEALSLSRLLMTNSYLFWTRNIRTAEQLMTELLNAFLSSSEEKLFGDFLEGLAVYIAGQTCNGHKSAAQGIDLEFLNQGTHYVVSIKSGPNWGNSSQHRRLAQDLRDATIRIKQARTSNRVEPVLGICYGKTRTTRTRDDYLKVVGQNFWYLISENEHLYTDIIEPIGYRAREHNEAFLNERDRVINRFTRQFLADFCIPAGDIDWVKLVEFNSGNYDLDQFPL